MPVFESVKLSRSNTLSGDILQQIYIAALNRANNFDALWRVRRGKRYRIYFQALSRLAWRRSFRSRLKGS
jgi:mRNA-degrading endonuclease RelE of RelBE toxin-antitoxin system